MAVKIKLKRVGKVHAPHYRVVVADSRTARNGRAIEEIGIYQPLEDPSVIKLDSDRVQYWLGVGAQPTEAVTAILKVTGDWQKFKGEPGAEGTLKVAPAKADKKIAYEAAVQDAASQPKTPTRAKAAAKVEHAVEDVVDKVEHAVEDVVEKAEHAVEDVVEKVEHAVESVTEHGGEHATSADEAEKTD